MTGIRFEVPSFVAEQCTGCAQCWTQCPDAAIPGLVSEVPGVLRAAGLEAGVGAALRARLPELAAESGRLLRAAPPRETPAATFAQASTPRGRPSPAPSSSPPASAPPSTPTPGR